MSNSKERSSLSKLRGFQDLIDNNTLTITENYVVQEISENDIITFRKYIRENRRPAYEIYIILHVNDNSVLFIINNLFDHFEAENDVSFDSLKEMNKFLGENGLEDFCVSADKIVTYDDEHYDDGDYIYDLVISNEYEPAFQGLKRRGSDNGGGGIIKRRRSKRKSHHRRRRQSYKQKYCTRRHCRSRTRRRRRVF